MMKCGISSNHFTNHSQRLIAASNRASTRTGFPVASTITTPFRTSSVNVA
jgi:predicted metal-dependent phosphotriesterase family hydrolase